MTFKATQKTILYLLFVFQMTLFVGCKNDESGPVPEVANLGVLDLGNNESSDDIYLRFTLSLAPEFIRIALIPESSLASFNVAQAKDLSNSQFMEMAGGLQVATRLQSIIDTNGDPIVNNKTYRIQIFFVHDGDILLAKEFKEVKLTTANPFIGEYLGDWSDNINTNIAISIRLKSATNNLLSGEFFATGTFVPYNNGASVGAVNDGSVRISMTDDNRIEQFTYNQYLPTYLGGCTGIYTGTGTYDDLTMEINYTGEDCDGIHEGGIITLFRSF